MRVTKLTREEVAKLAHEVNRAYCQANGDNSQVPWEEAPDWQKESALLGVDLHANDPDAGPQRSHESWMEQKVKDGWVYGPVKDAEKKEHPCLVPFDQLPVDQQAKDYIFRAVVVTASMFTEEGELVATAPVARERKAGMMHIQYIGHRGTHRDGIYETGDWTRFQVKDVPDQVAVRMLRHPDVYVVPVEVQADAGIDQVKIDKSAREDDEEKGQVARDAIAAMDTKEAVADYALTNFRIKIPKTLSLDNMKAQAAMLVDQYGAE